MVIQIPLNSSGCIPPPECHTHTANAQLAHVRRKEGWNKEQQKEGKDQGKDGKDQGKEGKD